MEGIPIWTRALLNVRFFVTSLFLGIFVGIVRVKLPYLIGNHTKKSVRAPMVPKTRFSEVE